MLSIIKQAFISAKNALIGVFVAMMAIISSVVFAPLANAALDVAPLTTEISSNSTSVQTVMLAILGVLVLLVGFNILRRVLR